MTFRITQEIAGLMIDAATAEWDKGSLRICSGTKPATLGAAHTSQLILAVFSLDLDTDPLFEPAVPTSGGATATANAIPATTAEAAASTGTVATFFEVLDSVGTVISDGDCSDTSGSAEMKLANTTIVAGIDVEIVSWTAVHPAAG